MRTKARALLCAGVAMMIWAAIGCSKIAPPTPLSQLNDQQLRGYYAFHTYCSQCHRDRTNDVLAGPALRGIFKKQYLNSGAPANDETVMGTILYGRGNMPAIGRNIAPDDRFNLLAYLHTL
ncbi:MAG TPA: cytochrome c [Acidobacteriaceae bacterium]|nr:cytochrome c [Acidobacteriaceae bacterium]